jgi:coenzyme F420-reducing hydrogenase delta subunit
MRKTLEEIGIDRSRVQMFNLSSAMAPEFARIAREMTDTISEPGLLTNS